jgi:nitrate reductase NapAB chaperone NapD
MPIASAVVEIAEGLSEAVLGSLTLIPEVSVYGVKENQIVVVMDGDSMGVIEESIRKIQLLEGVTGVYPVYSSIDE